MVKTQTLATFNRTVTECSVRSTPAMVVSRSLTVVASHFCNLHPVELKSEQTFG